MLRRLTLKRITSAAFWAVLLSLAAANGLPIRQNMQMRRALDAYRPWQLDVGAAVRPFAATALDGSPFGVSYDDRGPKKVMFYFTRTCPYCRQRLASITRTPKPHKVDDSRRVAGRVHAVVRRLL